MLVSSISLLNPSSELDKAYDYIESHSCNDYLNLTRLYIPTKLWEDIQHLLLINAISPPINRINITKTNISDDMINDELKPLIIRRY